MRVAPILAGVCIALWGYVEADQSPLLAEIPQCGIKCVLDILPRSSCGMTDQKCICANQDLIAATSACVLQNCTVIENLQFANVSSIYCEFPIRSNQGYLQRPVILEGVFLVVVALRFVSRWKLENGFKADDYIMIAIVVFSIPYSCLGVLSARKSFGVDIWKVQTADLVAGFKYFFVGEVFYFALLGLCKISILLFYLRIFPSRTLQISCYVVIIYVTAFTVTIDFLAIFQCTPLSYNWEGWKGNMERRCIDSNTQILVAAANTIAQDFIVLLLPLPWLVRLKVELWKKINVLWMFSAGIFVCITSGIRLSKIIEFTQTQNPTWDFTDCIYWSAIEVYVSMLIPCLPAVRSLLSHHFPRVFGTNSQNRPRKYHDDRMPHSFPGLSTMFSKKTYPGTSERTLANTCNSAKNSHTASEDHFNRTALLGATTGSPAVLTELGAEQTKAKRGSIKTGLEESSRLPALRRLPLDDLEIGKGEEI